jgi:TM2 domain-containing membrane protein YozV
MEPKNKILAGILGIMLGGFGVHKFVLGYTKEGFIMLLGSLVGGLVSCGLSTVVLSVIGLAEGIIYLSMSDADFVRTHIMGRKGWF